MLASLFACWTAWLGLNHGGRDGPEAETECTSVPPQTSADTTAAHVADELALAVLAAPGPPQLTTLGHLERNDKMRLGSTCTSLRQASLAWFPEVTVILFPKKNHWICQSRTDVASLAAWLDRQQARLHVKNNPVHDIPVYSVKEEDQPCWHLMVHDMHTYKDAFPSEEEWNNSLTALPSPLVTSLSLYSWAKDAIPAAISTLTALTRLDFVPFEYAEEDEVSIYPHWNDSPRSISVRHLAPLTRLRQLSFYNDDTHGDAEELLSLPALAGLQALQLRDWRLQAMPRALSALTRLTTLNLSKNLISTTAPLATLQHLQQLDLSHCSLTAVPQQLSALTALTRLDLAWNDLQSGWQHVLPLQHLQDLNLSWCSLTSVPQQLSGLTALTRLDLAWNDLQSGWQHLLPLQHLQDLNLSWIHESNLFSRTHFLEKI